MAQVRTISHPDIITTCHIRSHEVVRVQNYSAAVMSEVIERDTEVIGSTKGGCMKIDGIMKMKFYVIGGEMEMKFFMIGGEMKICVAEVHNFLTVRNITGIKDIKKVEGNIMKVHEEVMKVKTDVNIAGVMGTKIKRHMQMKIGGAIHEGKLEMTVYIKEAIDIHKNAILPGAIMIQGDMNTHEGTIIEIGHQQMIRIGDLE